MKSLLGGAVLASCLLAASSVRGQDLEVSITAPVSGTQVSERPEVVGTVSDPAAQVWVVVHPMEVSDYWVQPRLTVGSDGHWKVKIYVGRPGTVDVEKAFEIVAVANPEGELREGQVLDYWPAAAARSGFVEVTRK